MDRTLALTLAAAVVLIIANLWPLMELSVSGRQASTTIIGGALAMWARGQQMTALLVVFCTVLAPAVHIGITAAVLLFVRRTPAPSPRHHHGSARCCAGLNGTSPGRRWK